MDAATAESGDDEACDDDGYEAFFWSGSRGDGKCHGERKGDDGNGDACEEIAFEVVKFITSFKTSEEAWLECFRKEKPHDIYILGDGDIKPKKIYMSEERIVVERIDLRLGWR